MAIELTPIETDEAVASLQRFFREEHEQELSDLRARLLLDYVMKELAPLAYNRGVKDAEQYFRRHTEELPNICFEAPLTYWTRRKR